jgi:DNA repair protein SbcC/Rad50
VRPRRLHLAGFGAYPGAEDVDFDELARLGLFVVTGPTGAGKTTLFDAMAFALYGELPGGRPLGEVRSHHADPAEPCAVELEFAIEGVTYRVRRTPEQERPKRRGTGTTVEAATAELHRLDADGTEAPVASGTRPVTEACIALVGLDAGQFERVVLLPQGRFQAFLLADTRERRPLLQKLFGTALYRDAVEELKRRAAELRHRVAAVDVEIDHHRLNAKEHLRWVAAGLADEELDGVEPDDDLELLEAFWQKLAPGVADAERASRLLTEQASAATRAADAAAVLAARWDQRADLVTRAEALVAAQAEVARWRELAAAARRAAPVVAQAAVLDHARAGLAEAERAAAGASGSLRDQMAALDLGPSAPGADVDPDTADRALSVATDALERTAAMVGHLVEARAALDAALGARDRVEQRREALVADQARTAALRAELTERRAELLPVAGEAKALEAQVAASAELLARRRRLDVVRAEVERHRAAHTVAESRLAEVLAAFVAGAAPRLAAALRAGDACPVCGSTEHPSPAEPHDDTQVDVVALEKAQQRTARAASDLAAATAAVAEQLEVLGAEAERPVAELDAAHQVLLAAEKAAHDAVAALADVERRLAKGTEHHEALQARATALAAEQATAAAAVATAEARVAELVAEVGDTDPQRLTEHGRRLAAASDAVERCRAAVVAATTAAGAVTQAEAALAEALADSGFDDLRSARSAALAGAELHQLEQHIAGHDSALAEVQGGLAALADVELPVERPDVEALAAEAAELRRADDDSRTRVERLLDRGTQAQQAIAEARRVEDANTGLRDLRERTERVAAVADGQGPGRIGLETWVLAGELERVTEAANVHLARMTNGRYQLERTDDAGHKAKQAGLDLAVFDSHTGRARPPATLSGGEQFQASLALALGLADVVSLGGVGSGRRFEALFVDEGFGSLDPDALDQAVDALHQIHASGRMVGVITHVEAMKQQLPTGIEVVSRSDGRGSTLVAR